MLYMPDNVCAECGQVTDAKQTYTYTDLITYQCQNPNCMEVWN